MVKIQSPNGDPHYRSVNRSREYKSLTFGKSQPDEKMSKPTFLTSKPTFDSYKAPKGPDIRLGNTGPEYKTTTYQHKEYNPTRYKPLPYSVKDPLKSKPLYIDKPVGMYKGDVTYRLNKDNNAAMRNWDYGFVEDTVANRGTDRRSKDKYTVQPRHDNKKPVQSKPEYKPAVAAVAPVQKRQTPPPPPPPAPVAKSFKTTTTQTQVSQTKTLGTQYEREKIKTISVQTVPSTSSLPVLAPVPVPQSAKKVSTKSEATQCSVKPKTVVASTQSDFEKQARTRTPQYAEEARQETMVYTQRRSPSPEVVKENNHRNVSFKSPPPRVFIPPSEPVPQVTSYPDYYTSSQRTHKSGRGLFPYQTAKSHLPPEITACIEAYDIAHGPI